jgi:hypothetical protein
LDFMARVDEEVENDLLAKQMARWRRSYRFVLRGVAYTLDLLRHALYIVY